MIRLAATLLAWLSMDAPLLAADTNAELLALSEPDRLAAFTEHVQRNGMECDAVMRAMLLGERTDGRALWSVGCQNQKSYAVTVYADSKFRPFAVSCEDLNDFGKMLGTMERRLGQPQSSSVAECWKKF